MYAEQQHQFATMIAEARDHDFHPVHMLHWTWLYVFINGMDGETFDREYERTAKTCAE